jgi:hypothetical protein
MLSRGFELQVECAKERALRLDSQTELHRFVRLGEGHTLLQAHGRNAAAPGGRFVHSLG